jgi:hypothetical protein
MEVDGVGLWLPFHLRKSCERQEQEERKYEFRFHNNLHVKLFAIRFCKDILFVDAKMMFLKKY